MTLLLAVGVWEFADRDSNVVLLHAWLARLGIALVAVLCVTSVVFACKSLRIASATGITRAIPITASILSAFAALMWIITAIERSSRVEQELRSETSPQPPFARRIDLTGVLFDRSHDSNSNAF